MPNFPAVLLLKSFEISGFSPEREYSKLNFQKSSLLKNEFKPMAYRSFKTGNDTARIEKFLELALFVQ